MERTELDWLKNHLLEWCRKECRTEEAATELRDRIAQWCDANGEWGFAFYNGWPATRDRVQEYHEYNRSLALRMRDKPFRVARR